MSVWQKPLAYHIQKLITTYMDNDSYRAWTSTCKYWNDCRKSRTDTHNGQFITANVMKSVFEDKKNVLMHGPAGTGKSYTLNKIYKYAVNHGIKIVMTSLTAKSAQSLSDGKTLHSFAGLGIKVKNLPALQEKKTLISPGHRAYRRNRYRQWIDTDILVIDEVSMMGKLFYESLNWMAQTIRECNRPWGGMQVIFCGDFMQLQPVADRFGFLSDQWDHLNLQYIRFDINHRQAEDAAYARILHRIRMGQHLPQDIRQLKNRIQEYDDEKVIESIRKDNHIHKIFVSPQLMSKKKQVNLINEKYFNGIRGDTVTITAFDTYVEKIDGKYREVYHIPAGLSASKIRAANNSLYSTMQLKLGAQYILTHNIDAHEGLVNGAWCIYCQDPETYEPHLYFENGAKCLLERARIIRSFPVGNNVLLRRSQYALRLGYATTIHASQGMTLRHAVIDLGPSIFLPAQAYVALSRVTNLNNLILLDFAEKSLKVHKQAQDFVQNHEQNKEEYEGKKHSEVRSNRYKNKDNSDEKEFRIKIKKENEEEEEEEEEEDDDDLNRKRFGDKTEDQDRTHKKRKIDRERVIISLIDE